MNFENLTPEKKIMQAISFKNFAVEMSSNPAAYFGRSKLKSWSES
jgi:hypothetical protein